VALRPPLSRFASVALVAAVAPPFTWAVSGGGPASDDADGVGASPRGALVISGGFQGTSRLDATHSVASAGGYDIFAAGSPAAGAFGGPGGLGRAGRIMPSTTASTRTVAA
jgi:hypothetical protein